jgi:hypothetical protein
MTQITVRKYNDKGSVAKLIDDEDNQELTLFTLKTSRQPKRLCQKSAAKLRKLADAFDRLAEMQNPFNESTQREAMKERQTEADVHLHNDLIDRYAMLHEMLKNGLPPMIVGQECYSYIGEWVKIVSFDLYDNNPREAMCVIETRTGRRAQVEFGELQWHYEPRTIDRLTEVTRDEFVRRG